MRPATQTLVLAFLLLGVAAAQEFPSNRSVGVNVDQFIGSPERSMAKISHETIIARPILTAGDPNKPGPPAAVLEYHKEISLGTLAAGNRTPEVKHEDQEYLYVEKGKGRLESGDKYWPLLSGVGALVPPNAPHAIVNDTEEPLLLLILIDTLQPEVTPRKDILVRDVRQLPIAEKEAHWSYHAKVLFGPKDGINPQSKVLIVTMDSMSLGAPHPHVPHWEEVWCKLPPDTTYATLGSEVRVQKPNECFLVPPTGKTPHSVLNLSDHPMDWFYFGRYTHEVKYPEWVYQVPSVPAQTIRRK